MVGSLRSELREQEYKLRQEVCKEFNEQLIEIEDNHRYSTSVQFNTSKIGVCSLSQQVVRKTILYMYT